MAGAGYLVTRWRRSTRLDLVRQAAGVSPPLTAVAALLVVLSGLLPAGFSVATGALAGAVQRAVGRGLGSAPGRRVLLTLLVATAVYVLIQLVGPVRAAVGDMLMRRIDGSLAEQLMSAVSAPRSIAHLEDPTVLDRVAQAQGAVTGTPRGPRSRT
jgi:ATP-binding cassette subfamily B protein